MAGNATRIFVTICFVLFSWAPPLRAEGPPQSAGEPEKKVNIEHLKKQYWNQGGDLEVVQNRAYTKAKRVELGISGGFVNSDPFLSVNALGGSIGYYFSEVFGMRLVYLKDFARASSALKTLEATPPGNLTANTNNPKSFVGGEFGVSAIYGKLSLFGKAILYYDLHLVAGVGKTGTESGSYFTQFLGLSQQVFLSQAVSVRMDYKLMRYNEQILNKNSSSGPVGALIAQRDNWSNAILLGFNFFLF